MSEKTDKLKLFKLHVILAKEGTYFSHFSETPKRCMNYYTGAIDFLTSLRKDKSLKAISFHKIKNVTNGYISVKIIYESFSVSVNSSKFHSKKIPIIVEKCEEGYREAITGLVFDTKKFDNLGYFVKFAKDTGYVRPGYVADFIRSMSEEELKVYACAINNFKNYVENFGNRVLKEDEERIQNKKNSALEEQQRIDNMNNEDVNNSNFIREFQRNLSLDFKDQR